MASDDYRPKENDATRAVRFVELLRHADVSQEDSTISIKFDTAEQAFYAIRCLTAYENHRHPEKGRAPKKEESK